MDRAHMDKEYLTQVQRQFSGEKIVFSVNDAGKHMLNKQAQTQETWIHT